MGKAWEETPWLGPTVRALLDVWEDGLSQTLFTVGLAGQTCHAVLLEQTTVSGAQGWWRQDPGEQRLS